MNHRIKMCKKKLLKIEDSQIMRQYKECLFSSAGKVNDNDDNNNQKNHIGKNHSKYRTRGDKQKS